MKHSFFNMFVNVGLGVIGGTIVSFFSNDGMSSYQFIAFCIFSLVLIYIGNRSEKELNK